MDRVLDSIGPFGRYQKLVLILAGLVSSMTATVIYSTVFTAAAPRLICTRLNDSLVDNNEDYDELTTCQMWSELKRNSSAPYECVFDETYYESTLVTELGLVCEKAWMVSLTQTINLAGAVSGLGIGFFSDRFGRKRCALVLSSVLAAFQSIWQLVHFRVIDVDDSTEYVLFCVLQFFSGAMAKSLYTISYILIFELTTAKYTTIVSNVFSYMYVLGEFLVLVVAYIAPNWHIIMICMAVYAIFLVVLIAAFMPESPRFLMSMEYDEKLKKMLKRMATMNGKVCDTKQILETEIELENKEKIEPPEHHPGEVENVDEIIHDKHSAKQEIGFISQKTNILKIAAFVYIWFALSLTYYGVSLGITSIDDSFDPYLMFLLGSFAELIGYFMCHLNDRFGRKRMMMIFLLSASLFCIIVAFVPGSSSEGGLTWTAVLKIVFASIGKVSVSAAYTSCYIFNSMLFPTHVRTTVLVFTTNVGRIGALISPQINLLQSLVWSPLSYMIFSSASLAASVVVFFLPDPDKIKF